MDRKIVFSFFVGFSGNLMLQRTTTLVVMSGEATLTRWMETGTTETVDLLYADPKENDRAISI